jgi:hypothetical protein
MTMATIFNADVSLAVFDHGWCCGRITDRVVDVADLYIGVAL